MDGTNKLITVLTFTYQHESAIIRGRLESEGIECFMKDECTAQVNPLYSNALGGIKLQVKESDLSRALDILKEEGYLNDSDINPSNPLTKLNRLTSKIPLLNKLRPELRLILIVSALTTIVTIIIYKSTELSNYKKLTKTSWCLEYVQHKGKIYKPQTESFFYFSGEGFCEESIIFRKDSTVLLPGFKSGQITGLWKIEEGLLHISGADTFEFVYNGIYEINFSNKGLDLVSDKTKLHCDRSGSFYQFL